jgi:hypothetical protein
VYRGAGKVAPAPLRLLAPEAAGLEEAGAAGVVETGGAGVVDAGADVVLGAGALVVAGGVGVEVLQPAKPTAKTSITARDINHLLIDVFKFFFSFLKFVSFNALKRALTAI